MQEKIEEIKIEDNNNDKKKRKKEKTTKIIIENNELVESNELEKNEDNEVFENNEHKNESTKFISIPKILPPKPPKTWIDEFSEKLTVAMEEDNVSKKDKKAVLEHIENLKRAFFPELFLEEGIENNERGEEEEKKNEEIENNDNTEKPASPLATIEAQEKAIKEFQERCKRILQRSRFNQTTRSILGSLIVAAFMFVFVAIVGFTIGLLAGAWLGPAAFFAALAAGSAAAVSVITVAAVVASVSAIATAWFMFKQPHPSTLKAIKSLKNPDKEVKEDDGKPKPDSIQNAGDNEYLDDHQKDEDLGDYNYANRRRTSIKI